MSETSKNVITVRGLTKSYGATSVLKGVDFSVARGEVHALLGGNGAGKSTMIKIITGATSRNDGEIRFFDSDGSEAEGRAKVAVVHQELALLPHLTVAENIALPHQRRGAGLFRRAAAAGQAYDALRMIDQDFAARSLYRLVGSLSLHEGQMVEIARALSSGAELILLDEPTANLTTLETERLFAVLRRLTRDTGLSVVFVSHRMKEIRQIANVCTIIRDGRTVVDRQAMAELTDAGIIEKMGQVAASHAPERAPQPEYRSDASAATDTITIEEAGFRLELLPGTVLGVAGAPAGPAALIEALTGAARKKRWTVARGGWPDQLRSPRKAARLGAGYVTGDRAHKGVLHSLPIIDNVMASRRVTRGALLAGGSEGGECLDLLKALKVKAASVWDLPSTLSGGTQQKLLLARWLGVPSRLLVLEEPTRGVDIGTKREIYQLIRQMAASGTVIIWWSSENVELLEVCDRVIAFDTEGRCAGVMDRDDFSEEKLVTLTGMAA